MTIDPFDHPTNEDVLTSEGFFRTDGHFIYFRSIHADTIVVGTVRDYWWTALQGDVDYDVGYSEGYSHGYDDAKDH